MYAVPVRYRCMSGANMLMHLSCTSMSLHIHLPVQPPSRHPYTSIVISIMRRVRVRVCVFMRVCVYVYVCVCVCVCVPTLG